MDSKTIFFILLVAASVKADDGGRGFQGSSPALFKKVEDLYSECEGKHAVCVGMPPDCTGKACTTLVSVAPSKDSSAFTFRLLDSPDDKQFRYAAVGIALDGTQMKDTAIVACKTNSDVEMYWSSKATTPHLVQNPAYLEVKEVNPDINGKLYCVFNLKGTFSEHGLEFNLKDKKYALLLAKGRVDLESRKLKYHDSKHRPEPASLVAASGGWKLIPSFIPLVSGILWLGHHFQLTWSKDAAVSLNGCVIFKV